jgi:hypothetical protein
MLGLVLGRLVETLADVLAARGFDHAIGNVTLEVAQRMTGEQIWIKPRRARRKLRELRWADENRKTR